MKNNLVVIPYSEGYFCQLIDFLRKNWAPNHLIYNKQLFDWQYGGMASDFSSNKLLIDESNAIQGFLGAVSYPFLFNNEFKKAAGLSVWIVDKEVRNSGAGSLLKTTIEDSFDIVYAIGINLDTVRYYKKYNYNFFDGLYRYVIPLDLGGYQLFLNSPHNVEDVKNWFDTIAFTRAAHPTIDFCANILSETYANCVAPHFSFCPHKDVDFWRWRYLESKGFTYMFFQGKGGIVLFRIECAHSPSDSLRHGIKCLRIIEILPNNGNVWENIADQDLSETLLAVVTWAKNQGCVLADFQISNSRLSHILQTIGFKHQSDIGITNVARLFRPYKVDVFPLNFAYRIPRDNEFVKIDREETYLLKSDSDMDRPNFLQ